MTPRPRRHDWLDTALIAAVFVADVTLLWVKL